MPMISIFGKAPTQEHALRVTKRATEAFRLSPENHDAAGSRATSACSSRWSTHRGVTLILPRKKTLPIFVFLAVLFATIAFVFVLDNARPA